MKKKDRKRKNNKKKLNLSDVQTKASIYNYFMPC